MNRPSHSTNGSPIQSRPSKRAGTIARAARMVADHKRKRKYILLDKRTSGAHKDYLDKHGQTVDGYEIIVVEVDDALAFERELALEASEQAAESVLQMENLDDETILRLLPGISDMEDSCGGTIMGSGVLCPICKSNDLVLDNMRRQIRCSSEFCTMHVDNSFECLTLEQIRYLLAQALEEHSATCTAGLLFACEDRHGTGIRQLYGRCPSCAFLAIIC